MIKKIIITIILVLWCLFIFTMSSHTGSKSGGLSDKIVNQVVLVLKVLKKDKVINKNALSIMIRKLAHFTIYLILTIIAIIWAKVFGLNHYLLYPLIFSIIYAISDEVHQLFIPGRSGNILDVLIDASGSIFTIFLWRLYEKNN